eukprot:362623-Chlamydomonas_euryale.AAC.2
MVACDPPGGMRSARVACDPPGLLPLLLSVLPMLPLLLLVLPCANHAREGACPGCRGRTAAAPPVCADTPAIASQARTGSATSPPPLPPALPRGGESRSASSSEAGKGLAACLATDAGAGAGSAATPVGTPIGIAHGAARASPGGTSSNGAAPPVDTGKLKNSLPAPPVDAGRLQNSLPGTLSAVTNAVARARACATAGGATDASSGAGLMAAIATDASEAPLADEAAATLHTRPMELSDGAPRWKPPSEVPCTENVWVVWLTPASEAPPPLRSAPPSTE